MVEADPGLDPGGENAVDQAIVEFETLLVGGSPGPRAGGAARRLTADRRRGPIRASAPRPRASEDNGRRQRRRCRRRRSCRAVAKNVPDRRAAAVLPDGTLDLIGGGRCAPQKTLGKARRHPPSARRCTRAGAVSIPPGRRRAASRATGRGRASPQRGAARQRHPAFAVPRGDRDLDAQSLPAAARRCRAPTTGSAPRR